MATKLSLCSDRLISELSHLQRIERFRKMIVRCQEQNLQETLLDILAFLYKRDNRVAMVEADTTKYCLAAQNGLLTYNGKFGIIDNRYYKRAHEAPSVVVQSLT